MVDPFLPTVKLLVSQFDPSANLTMFPVLGEDGKLYVNDPPEVSAIIC